MFPLQVLGFDVDIINSVHFSNHTGHPHGFTGEVMNGTQLSSILQGLEQNNLLSNIHHLLTGYIGSASFLESVLNVLQTLKQSNPNIRYVCDPVLGDDGKVYVPPELVDIYRTKVIPLANVVTPNQFEAEILTGIQIHTMKDAIAAAHKLHELGPDLVVITSLSVKSDHQNDIITILASKRKQQETNHEVAVETTWIVETPKISGRYTGTGDLTSALFLAWTTKLKHDLKGTLERVASTMYALIKYTSQQSSDESIASRELKLIQCKKDIENPTILFEAKQII